MDTVTWQALTVVLTLLGLAGTVFFWRRRGAVSGLRMLALSLLPAAAYLTGTLRLLWQVGDAVASWAARLVLSPTVWLGVALAATSMLLLVVTGALRRRGAGTGNAALPRDSSRPAARPQKPGGPAATSGQTDQADDDLADIEAILKRHGIS
jgi:hypothetical protein